MPQKQHTRQLGADRAGLDDFSLAAESGPQVILSPAEHKSWRDRIAVHPAADLFPMMSDAELDELGRDIREHGLRQPVILWTPGDVPRRKGPKEFYLLDGRNRLAAIERAFADDPEECDSELRNALSISGHGDAELKYSHTDPWAYVVSTNLHRRHLTRDQKRDLIAKLLAANPTKSDRAIGKLAQADHKTVAAVRSEIEERGEIPHVENRVDSAGRHQPAAKPQSKEAQIRALRERQVQASEAAPQPTGSPISTAGRFSLVNELERVTSVLKGDIGRVNQIPLVKRVALARGVLMALGVTLDDLRPLDDGGAQ